MPARYAARMLRRHGVARTAATLMVVSLVAPLGARSAAGARPLAFFRDVAKEWGLPDGLVGRAVAVDLDGDGYADLVCDAGRRVYRNAATPDGKRRRFVDVTAESGLAPTEGARGADVLAWGDVDGDGDVDCFYGRNRDFAGKKEGVDDDGQHSEIRLNDGHGHFTVRAGSGVGEHGETTCCATFFDYDRDGVLDLYVGNWYVRYGKGLECFPSRLFHGSGDGTFEDVTEKAKMLGVEEVGRRDSRRPVYGVATADWNDDGRTDLLVCAYGRQWNVLWRNNGDGTFTDVGEETGFDGDEDRSGIYPAEARANPKLKDLEDEKPFRSNGNTFDAAVADFDGDGDLDVFEADITHWWAGPSSDKSSLLVNGGRDKGWKFTREERGIVRTHAEAHWNQGDLFAGWLDVGDDGRLDLFVASGDYPDEQRLRIWRQKPDHTFEEATKTLGLDWTNCTQPTVADFDRNGTQDLFLGNSNMRATAEQAKARVLRPALFVQTEEGHWMRLTLRGGGKGHANTSAIGAKVVVKAGGLVAVREVSGARGHAGHHDEAALTIGLGDHDKVDEVRVRWPDSKGTVEWFAGVTVDHAWRLVEGGGAPVADDVKR